MKKNICFFIVMLALSACGILFWVEIDCREFKLDFENYWSSVDTGSVVVYLDDQGNENVYTLEFRRARHTSKYYSDTGCGCSDVAYMRFSNSVDTILLFKDSFYQYDNDEELLEEIYFYSKDQEVYLNTLDKIGTEDVEIGDVLLEKCIVFEKDLEDTLVKVYLSPNFGIVKYIDTEGVVWTIKELDSSNDEIVIGDFEYYEIICD